MGGWTGKRGAGPASKEHTLSGYLPSEPMLYIPASEQELLSMVYGRTGVVGGIGRFPPIAEAASFVRLIMGGPRS